MESASLKNLDEVLSIFSLENARPGISVGSSGAEPAAAAATKATSEPSWM
jgi:hypothetical protein